MVWVINYSSREMYKTSSIMMEFYFGLWYIFGERVIVLEIKTGYIYHIKDDFFDKIKEKMLNELENDKLHK